MSTRTLRWIHCLLRWHTAPALLNAQHALTSATPKDVNDASTIHKQISSQGKSTLNICNLSGWWIQQYTSKISCWRRYWQFSRPTSFSGLSTFYHFRHTQERCLVASPLTVPTTGGSSYLKKLMVVNPYRTRIQQQMHDLWFYEDTSLATSYCRRKSINCLHEDSSMYCACAWVVTVVMGWARLLC